MHFAEIKVRLNATSPSRPGLRTANDVGTQRHFTAALAELQEYEAVRSHPLIKRLPYVGQVGVSSLYGCSLCHRQWTTDYTRLGLAPFSTIRLGCVLACELAVRSLGDISKLQMAQCCSPAKYPVPPVSGCGRVAHKSSTADIACVKLHLLTVICCSAARFSLMSLKMKPRACHSWQPWVDCAACTSSRGRFPEPLTKMHFRRLRTRAG